jgi:uncharacterized membrane protein YfcA
MQLTLWLFLPVVLFMAALLYSAVGQAGASGYLAIMALFSMAPEIMKPAALALNIVAAVIASVKFYRAGYFSWSTLWPFAATSIPFSFIGGSITLPGNLYKPAVAVVLLFAAFRLFRASQVGKVASLKPIPIPAALLCGAVIGLIAGLTGIGGGIFLTPLLLVMSWAEPRGAAGVSAVFILVNSIAGLAGSAASLANLPQNFWLWGIAVAAGAFVGAELGSRRLGNVVLQRVLVVVLVIAAVKMLL